jgi:hypothetical protein
MGLRQLYHPLITATDSDRELAFQQLSLNGKPADHSEGPTDQRERGLSTNCMELSSHRPTAANTHSESTLGYWSVPADPIGARAQNFHAETAGIFVFRPKVLCRMGCLILRPGLVCKKFCKIF